MGAATEGVVKVAESVKPVRFSNVSYPWEQIVGPAPEDAPKHPKTGVPDPATRPVIRFISGHYTAKQAWEIETLRKLPHVYEDDSPTLFGPCPSCQFTTYSSRAYNEHMGRHIE